MGWGWVESGVGDGLGVVARNFCLACSLCESFGLLETVRKDSYLSKSQTNTPGLHLLPTLLEVGSCCGAQAGLELGVLPSQFPN